MPGISQVLSGLRGPLVLTSLKPNLKCIFKQCETAVSRLKSIRFGSCPPRHPSCVESPPRWSSFGFPPPSSAPRWDRSILDASESANVIKSTRAIREKAIPQKSQHSWQPNLQGPMITWCRTRAWTNEHSLLSSIKTQEKQVFSRQVRILFNKVIFYFYCVKLVRSTHTPPFRSNVGHLQTSHKPPSPVLPFSAHAIILSGSPPKSLWQKRRQRKI